MSASQSGPARLPDDLITVTPVPGGLTFAYQQQTDGVDVISVIVHDEHVGDIRVLLTADVAMIAAHTINSIIADLDDLRAQWDNRNQ